MNQRIIQLNGHDTRIYTSGDSGPAVMFLHGFPEHGGAWWQIFERMAGFRCFAPDQRGYGISYMPEEVREYSGGKLARDVLSMLDVLGLKRVHLVGHDWGASVAYATAFIRDPRIASLTIANGVHPVPFQREIARGGPQCEASQYINWLRKPGSEEVLAANGFEKLAGFFAKNMDMGWMTPQVLDIYRAAWGDVDSLRCMVNWYRATPLVVGLPGEPVPTDQLPEIPKEAVTVTVPHQLIWGSGDTALLPESTEGLEDFCALGLTRHEIPGTDHWIIHQKPDEVASLLRNFIAEHD